MVISEDAKKIIDEMPEDALRHEINLGPNASRFAGERFAYLRTRLDQILQSKSDANVRRQTQLAEDANNIAAEANKISRAASRRSWWSIGAASLSALIALAALLKDSLPGQFFRSRFDWIQISDPAAKPKTGTGTSVGTISADIALPTITSITMIGKFTELDAKAETPVRFGYNAAVDVDHLDLSKIPKHYLQDEPVEGTNVTELGLKEVPYKFHFHFYLRDKDGFTIRELDGPTETVVSGKRNKYQRLIDEPVTRYIAQKTAKVGYYLSVDKCAVCAP